MASAPKPETGSLIVDLLVGDRVQIGSATVEMLHKTGRHARVQIRAPRDVLIKRCSSPDKSVPSMAECEPD